ncbi:fungal-specific transcription factor domain-containing protein [Trichophaea hybrida]|nr:fungal-specific transcription factor domain-containing protein [Trichophaea hybrida]
MQSLDGMGGLQSPHSYLLPNAAAVPPPQPHNVLSPPLIRIASSENGSYEYESGDQMGGIGRSLSPPTQQPSAFLGSGGGGGSVTSSAPKPKRKRSMIACKNCNERRVRCDGATNGLPCSNCKHAGKSDCQFIESKRVRGARGRFESRGGMGSSTSPTTSTKRPLTPSSVIDGSCAPRRARRHSITGTDGEEWRRLLQNSASANRSTTCPVTYLGESWHLSWVMQEQMQRDNKPLHLPMLMMQDDGDVYNRVNKELWEKGAYVLPRYEVRDLLISQYFEMCHPLYPIVCKTTFLHSLQTNTFSHQLVQAVLMFSATHCDWAILQRAGYVSRREAVDGFYKRARALWDGDVEPDKITNIQTMFLMQFWWRSVTDQKDPLWWLSGATRLAQSMGLHRSAERSKLNQRDKRIWRRIWWLLFLRDRQASPYLGKPLMIYGKDCDVEELELADLDGEVDKLQGLSLLEHLKLAKLMAALVECEFSPGVTRNIDERTALRERCHQRLNEWQRNVPEELAYRPESNNRYSMTLQMAFFAQLLLLNRPAIYTDETLPEEIRNPSEKIAGNAADAITKITDDMMKMWGPRYISQNSMSCVFAAITVQMIQRRTTEPKAAREADTKLRQNMAYVAQLDKILPMAGWVHRRYSRILEREVDLDEARTVSISPPANVEVTNNIAIPAMILSQRTPPPQPPPPPPQMHTITEVGNNNHNNHVNGNSKQEDDEWGHDCEQLLNMEHSLTDPSIVLEHNIGMNGDGSAAGSSFHKQKQHEQPQLQQSLREGYSHVFPGLDIRNMQQEIYDYHWFMDNVGGIDSTTPFWLSHNALGGK